MIGGGSGSGQLQVGPGLRPDPGRYSPSSARHGFRRSQPERAGCGAAATPRSGRGCRPVTESRRSPELTFLTAIPQMACCSSSLPHQCSALTFGKFLVRWLLMIGGCLLALLIGSNRAATPGPGAQHQINPEIARRLPLSPKTIRNANHYGILRAEGLSSKCGEFTRR
jgi:hypothetical protein